MESEIEIPTSEKELKEEADNFREEFNNLDKISKIILILDQLKNENRNIRYFCINNLTSVAELLGPARTEEELLPLILDYIINFEDNEEILSNLSFKLFDLINFVTIKSNICIILRALELLAGNDDESVSKNATDNLGKIISISDDKLVQNDIFPLMQRMIINDIRSKISCCYLFPLVYQKLTCENIRAELFQVFNEISGEDSPSVRRAAAANIGDLALCSDSNLLNEIINLHSKFLKDNVDIVKVLAIEAIKNLLINANETQKKIIIGNFISAINKDKSWRVKYASADTICDIVQMFDLEFNELNFLPSIMLFLKDTEPEVRSSAVGKIISICKYISKEKLTSNILPILNDMISDINHHVRSLLASSLMNIGEIVDEEVFENNIYEMINKILKDETLEVKNSAVCGMDKISRFLANKSIADKLVNPMINEISRDSKWRIRLSLCERLKVISQNFEIDLFKKNFMNILTLFFMDHAYEIRKTTVEIFNILMERDMEESKVLIWEKIKSSLLSNNYILRIEGLKAIDFLKEHFYKSWNSSSSANHCFLKSEIIPFILLLKDDKVANVRFNICILFQHLYIFLRKEKLFKTSDLEGKIKTVIGFYCDDGDLDVKYFSEQAIKNIQN